MPEDKGRNIKAVTITDVDKRKTPTKHYVYIINVAWSDGKQQVICRRYNNFFTLQTSLIDTFPEESGVYNPTQRILPFLPGKILFGRSNIREVAVKRKDFINEYLEKLIKLPPKISKCELVKKFFEANENDIKSLLSGGEKRKSVKTADNISEPILLEQYVVVANFKKTDRSQISLAAGDTVGVIEKHENGWWFVCLEDEQGWAPSSYLEPLDGNNNKAAIEVLKPGQEEKYICSKTFKATQPDEITVNVGDVVDVLEKHPDGWWKVRISSSSEKQEGFMPCAQLKKVPKSAHANLATAPASSSPATPKKREFVPPPRQNTVKRKVNRKLELQQKIESRNSSGKREPPPVPRARKVSNEKKEEEEEEVIYVALSNFKTDADQGNLHFSEGAQITILEKDPNGWWFVRVDDDEGWIPSTVAQRTRRPRDIKYQLQKNNPDYLKPVKETFVTIGSYKPTEETGISFEPGEKVEVLNMDPCGWWFVRINGEEGWAPSTFLEKEGKEKKRKAKQRLSNDIKDIIETIPIGVPNRYENVDTEENKPEPPPPRKTSQSNVPVPKPRRPSKGSATLSSNPGSRSVDKSTSSSNSVPRVKPRPPSNSTGKPAISRKPDFASPVEEGEDVHEVLGDYEDDDDGMLNLQKGLRVVVLEKDEGGWWYARNGDRTGWVPSNFLKKV